MCSLSTRGFSANAVALPHFLPNRACSLFVSLHVTGPGIRILAASRRSAAVALFIKASKSRRGIFRIFARAPVDALRSASRPEYIERLRNANQPTSLSAVSAANPPTTHAAMCVGEHGARGVLARRTNHSSGAINRAFMGRVPQ